MNPDLKDRREKQDKSNMKKQCHQLKIIFRVYRVDKLMASSKCSLSQASSLRKMPELCKFLQIRKEVGTS